MLLDVIYAGTARGGTSSAAAHFQVPHESVGFNEKEKITGISTGMIWPYQCGDGFIMGLNRQQMRCHTRRLIQLVRHPFDQVKALACRPGLARHNYVNEIRSFRIHERFRDDWAALLWIKRTSWLYSIADGQVKIETLPVWVNKELRPHTLEIDPQLMEVLAFWARVLNYDYRETVAKTPARYATK